MTAGLSEYETPALYRGYEALREQRGSVSWDEDTSAWLVLGFDDCEAVLHDETLFAHPNRRDLMDKRSWNAVAATLGGQRALALLDADKHRVMHTQIAQRIARNILAYRDTRIVPVVDHLLARFVEQGRGEFATDCADPMPVAVIASVLGLPWDDEILPLWKPWDTAVSLTRSRLEVAPEFGEMGRSAARRLDAAILPVVKERFERLHTGRHRGSVSAAVHGRIPDD